jgi:hypothetical protein
MLTIAGGILLAILAISTVGIWLPILMWLLIAIFWLLVAAIVLGIGYAIVKLVIDYPQESIEFGVFIGSLSLLIFVIMRLQDWWIDKQKKKIDRPYFLEKLKDEYGDPNVLDRNKDKNQIIAIARQLGIKVGKYESKSDIAKKIFSIGVKVNKEISKVEINLTEDKDNFGGRGTSLLKKIDQAKDKEITRINDEKEKAKEAKRKENELLVERFFTIKTALEELELTYARDEDIDVSVSERSACLILGKYSTYEQRKLQIEPNPYCEGFYVHGFHDAERRNFDHSEEVVDYIIALVGKFLAERESK